MAIGLAHSLQLKSIGIDMQALTVIVGIAMNKVIEGKSCWLVVA